jgi:hypothetical protein
MTDDPVKRAWVTRVLGVQFAEGGDAGASPAGGFGSVRARWQKARTQVDADLAAFRAALLADAGIKSDSRLNFIRAAAAEIPNMLPAPGRRIETLLASGEATPDTAKAVLAAVGEYRQALAGAQGLAKLEAFASGSLHIPLALRDMLSTAMDEIEAAVRAAA